jgi:hypothetical protein
VGISFAVPQQSRQIAQREGLEPRYHTENKDVIENYASHKRRKLPIRGYLVRIRYTRFCPQFAQITVTFKPHAEQIPFCPPVLAN